MEPSRERHDYLRRLPEEFYVGNAYVHWSMTVQDRRTGWLDDPLHDPFRELLLHTTHRYMLIAPVYCLMPDHLHVLLIGVSPQSHQLNASRFFRRGMNRLLRKSKSGLQKQGFDNVLREKDREHGAVSRVIGYIVENPVRAGLVDRAKDWAYSGSMAAGHPNFDWRSSRFYEELWTIIENEMKRCDWTGHIPVAEERSSSDLTA